MIFLSRQYIVNFIKLMNKEKDFRLYSLCSTYGELEAKYMKVQRTRMLKLRANESSWFYKKIGIDLLESGYPQKAAIYLKKAFIIQPQDYEISLNLAQALLDIQKEKECFSCLKKALSFSPTSDGMIYLHGLLIKTLEERDRSEEIESFYQEIADQLADPTDLPFFYFESAKILTLCDIYPLALQYFKKAIESHPHHDFYFEYARALHHEGEYEEAITQLEHSCKLSPENKTTRSYIAFLHYCLGRATKAFEELKEIEFREKYGHLLLLLYHFQKDEEKINKFKNTARHYLQRNNIFLRAMYSDEVRLTEKILKRGNLGENSRKFEEKKLKALNMVLSSIK